MSAIHASWDHLWTPLSKDRLLGWVSSLKQAEAVREAYEVDKSTFFVSRCKAAHFGEHTNSIQNKFRIRYKDLKDAVVPYDGVPFVIQSRYERDCMFGKDKHKATKDRLLAAREEQLKNSEPIPKRSRRIQNWSRKQGCPAKIIMKEVIRFPSFRLKTNTEFIRRITSERLRTALECGKQLIEEHRVYIRFPNDGDHDEAHRAGLSTGCMHPLNEDVLRKLNELAVDGNAKVKAVLRQLRLYVQTELFKDQPFPPKSDLSYYPMYGTVRKHLQMAQQRLSVAAAAGNVNTQLNVIIGQSTAAHRPNVGGLTSPSPPTCQLEMHTVDVEASDDQRLSAKELATICRGKLSSIRRSSYLCHDADALRQLAAMLGQVEEYFNYNMPSSEVGSASDDVTDFAACYSSAAPKRKGRRRSYVASAKRRKQQLTEGEVADGTPCDNGTTLILGDHAQRIGVEAAEADGCKQSAGDSAQPIIHLLFVDRTSDMNVDEQYTELSNEQLASLVSASFQQQGMTI